MGPFDLMIFFGVMLLTSLANMKKINNIITAIQGCYVSSCHYKMWPRNEFPRTKLPFPHIWTRPSAPLARRVTAKLDPFSATVLMASFPLEKQV